MNIISTIALCNFESAKWLFFGPNVAPLVYYSHLPIAVISLFLAFYILFQNKKNLANKILFVMIITFVAWVLMDSVFWASNRSDVIMLVWSLIVLIEPLVYIGSLYLLYVLIDKKDLSFNKKLALGLLYLPLIILAPTIFNLSSFDISTCLSTEGPLALYYTYFVEILVIIWVLVFSIERFMKAPNLEVRQEIVGLTVGTFLFLFAFAWGNIIGSFTDNWQLGQYGLFGMPIFIGFLVHSIVKFKTFNIKLIATQALVFVSGSLIFSQFFFIQNNTNRILNSITFLIFVVVGIFLVRSVKKEVEQREKIEKLAGELKTANEGQVSLMHFMNHQIKGRFGNAKNIFAELMTGDYGVMPADTVPLLEKGLEETDTGINYVQGILKGASAESGTLPYDMKPLDMKLLVEDVVSKQKEHTDKKGLVLNLEITPGDYNIIGDTTQLGEAVRNLIDNSINYTEHGGITITLSCHDKNIKLTVKDTGIGIAPEDRDRLFKAGGRGVESLKININATGYGLVFVKGVVEAHKGKVWVESPGRGRGSTFIIELPHLAISLQEQYTFSTF